MSQDLLIPSDSNISAELSFQLLMPECLSNNNLYVIIDDSLIMTINQQDSLCVAGGYQQFHFDISTFADSQAHKLSFIANIDSSSQGFILDDVNVCINQNEIAEFKNERPLAKISDIKISPNPVNTYLTMLFPLHFLDKEAQIKLYSANGKLIKSEKVLIGQDLKTQWNMVNENVGVYFLSVECQGSFYSKSIVKY